LTLALPSGAIAPVAGQRLARLTNQAACPVLLRTAPSDLFIAGNVYRIEAVYESGKAIHPLRHPGQLTLVYPAAPDDLYHKHFVLHSTRGRDWKAFPTKSLALQHQTTANLSSLGHFAVGTAKRVTIPKPFGGSRRGVSLRDRLYLVPGGIVLLFAVAIAIWRWRNRRAEQASGAGKRSR